MSERPYPPLALIVRAGLEFFVRNEARPGFLPEFPYSVDEPVFAVGRGNAERVADLIFANFRNSTVTDQDAFLEHYEKVRAANPRVVLVSSSGGKGLENVMEYFKSTHVPYDLFTCKDGTEVGESADNLYLFPSSDEPFSYNFSTYFSMLLSSFGESPSSILELINSIPEFDVHTAYAMAAPSRYEKNIRGMFDHKCNELFGGNKKPSLWSESDIDHGAGIVRADGSVIFGVGIPEERSERIAGYISAYDKERSQTRRYISVPFTPEHSYAAYMAVMYHIIGKVQEKMPDLFGQNVEEHIRATNAVTDWEVDAKTTI